MHVPTRRYSWILLIYTCTYTYHFCYYKLLHTSGVKQLSAGMHMRFVEAPPLHDDSAVINNQLHSPNMIVHGIMNTEYH